MRRLIAMACVAVLGGCEIPDKLCDTVPEDNTCSGDGDCVKAFCSAECDTCRKVYSRRQAERAYCLVIVGGSVPERCRDAYNKLDCTDPLICPEEMAEARCVDGQCVPVRP